MTVFDYVVLVVVGLSVLLAVLRGGVSEILSLAAWLLGFWLAQHYAPTVANLLPAEVPSTELRLIAGFIGILLGVWFVSAILRITVSQFVKATGLAPVDRIIGAFFGMARGILMVLALVLVAGMTSLPHQPVWREAMFSPPFEAMALALKPWLPPQFAGHIRFD